MTKKNLMKPPKHVAEFLASLDLVPVTKLPSLSPEQRFDHAALGDHMELAGVLYKGFALAGLKEQVGHGEYLAGLAQRGIDRVGAWRAISLAQLSTRVSRANFSTLKHLAPSKLALMVTWSDGELTAFFKGETVRGITLEDAQTTSVRELQRQIKDATAQEAQWKKKVARYQDTIAQLEGENRELKARDAWKGELPASISDARTDGHNAGMKALDGLWEMEGLYNRIARGEDISTDPDEAKRQLDAGVPALYVNLMAVLANGTQLVRMFQEHFADYLPDFNDELDVPLLDPDECEKILRRHNAMLTVTRVEPAKPKKKAGKKRGRKS